MPKYLIVNSKATESREFDDNQAATEFAKNMAIQYGLSTGVYRMIKSIALITDTVVNDA